MDSKQLLDRAYQDMQQLKNQVSSLKGKTARQANLIKQLTDALPTFRRLTGNKRCGVGLG